MLLIRSLNMSAVAGSSADRRKFYLYGPAGQYVPTGLDMGYKILSLSPQNLSAYTFMTTGLFNFTNATMQETLNIQAFLSKNNLLNSSEYGKLSNTWDRSVPWAPSSVDISSEPKVFVCGGQLLPGSASFTTACFVDTSTCRSGAVRSFEEDAPVDPYAPVGEYDASSVPYAPKIEKLEFVYPLPPSSRTASLRSVLEAELKSSSTFMSLEMEWNTKSTFRVVETLYNENEVDPLNAFELDSMLKAKASDEEILRYIKNYTENYSPHWMQSISNTDVLYGFRSVSTLGVENLPVITLGGRSDPMTAASPFIVKDSNCWNWTVHPAVCHHETLLCEAVVDSGVVTNAWGCTVAPIFCQNDEYDCRNSAGVGGIWTAEPSLAYSINSVREHLMRLQGLETTYDIENATWLHGDELSSVLTARRIFEKSFSLLHFAWSMSTLPLNFNSTANDTLLALNVTRVDTESRVAIATDMIFLCLMLICFAVAFFGGGSKLLMSGGRGKSSHRVGWNPVDFYQQECERLENTDVKITR
ncbi:hypothetical protein HDU97_004700 [Phlyctochytrium planicorne]|nr:hypothetical protein HDU97_004700 [Phlyctochytrium planicorne]